MNMEKDILQASVITIGDELMIGQVIDTNSAWIAQQLNIEGIWVRRRVSVGDNYDEIWETLDEESKKSKIILITGGLGPTADDITKPLLCEYFGSKLVVDEKVLEHVRHLFEDVFKRPFTEINRKQAEVPANCTVIHNARGTAPGMMFEKNGVVYISMPGVPHEMKGMMNDHVIPMFREKFNTGFIIHRTLLTVGIGESFLAEHINSWEKSLPEHLKLAYLPGYGMVRLRITGTGSDKNKLESEVLSNFERVKVLVKQWLVTDEDITLTQAVSKILKSANKTVSTAESCTGGYISHLITSEPGSSAIFKGSVVCYSNQVKTDVLKVSEQTLKTKGAVSEETVREMVIGAIGELKTDYCIATSGIMGPDGGTEDKPVGTVWIAAGDKDHVITQKFNFRFDRARNIEMTAMQGLNLLRKALGSQ
jgi:nicotinamide-nucleotide amidase